MPGVVCQRKVTSRVAGWWYPQLVTAGRRAILRVQELGGPGRTSARLCKEAASYVRRRRFQSRAIHSLCLCRSDLHALVFNLYYPNGYGFLNCYMSMQYSGSDSIRNAKEIPRKRIVTSEWIYLKTLWER